MNRYFLIMLTFFFIWVGHVNASVYKGQKMFVKECLKCHQGGQVFVAEKTIREWKKLMKKKGKPLADIHLNSSKVRKHKRAKKALKYFKNKKYKKKAKHLRHFLVEYAKDSGNAPACD